MGYIALTTERERYVNKVVYGSKLIKSWFISREECTIIRRKIEGRMRTMYLLV